MTRTPSYPLFLCLWAALTGCEEDRHVAGIGAGGSHRKVLEVKGAGATFPYKVYSKWARTYFEQTGVRLVYQGIGSFGGIEAIKAGKVDFGATDIPLTKEELEHSDLIQFPMVIGAVIPVVNIPGVETGTLALSADTLARIYLGMITKWNDEAIVALNPTLTLPDEEIIPIHRSDASGSTWIFTRYMSGNTKLWRPIGMGEDVSWPLGVGAKSNAQVARFVKQFKHTLAYVEFSHAIAESLTLTRVSASDGEIVCPTFAALEKAATRCSIDGLRVAINRDESGGWPIMGASYILLPRQQRNAYRSKQLLRFFEWALKQGERTARLKQHVPIPARMIPAIEENWSRQLRAEGEPVWQIKKNVQPTERAPADTQGAK